MEVVTTPVQVLDFYDSIWNNIQNFLNYPLLRDHQSPARDAVILMLARVNQSKSHGRIDFCEIFCNTGFVINEAASNDCYIDSPI